MKKLSLILLVLLIGLNINAQDFDKNKSAFSKSYEYENSGEYSKAIEELKTVYDEKSYEFNVRIAWLSYMSGLFTESIAFYQKAIALMPYSIEARLGVVYPMSALGNWNQVITQYNKILELDPANATANYRLGMIYYGKNEFEKALSYFQKNVNFYPFTYDSLIMLAWTNYKLGKTREAKILFQKCLLYNPDDSSAQEGLGLIK